MFADRDDLDILKARVERGEPGAAARLRQQLEPQMKRIVGRALRAGKPATPVARHIVAQAQQIAPQDVRRPGAGAEQLMAVVARQLCDRVVARLGNGLATAACAGETVGP